MSTASLPAFPARWFTLRQIVRHLRDCAPDGRAPFGVKTLRRAIASGELPASSIGNTHLVRLADLDVWIASRRIEPRDPQREARVAERVAERLRAEAALAPDAARPR